MNTVKSAIPLLEKLLHLLLLTSRGSSVHRSIVCNGNKQETIQPINRIESELWHMQQKMNKP